MFIASFDIGKVNFAFCVEKIDDSKLESCKILKKNRYNSNGTPTKEFSIFLDKIYSNGEIILLENLNITNGSKKYIDSEFFYNMNDLLDQYSKFWDCCDVFVIEQQMSFGKKINTMALKLGQHCYSYFTFRYGRFKKVIEFPAYHKTQVLGAPKIEGKGGKFKNMDKPKRKKWVVDQVSYILNHREDFETLEKIINSKKKDDLSDVICQLQAYKCLI